MLVRFGVCAPLCVTGAHRTLT